MNARFSRSIVSVVMVGVLALTALAVTPFASARQDIAAVARVRIGYFAFDPREYDTFVDGKLASFNDAWNYSSWHFPSPSDQFVCCSTTPFMDVPAGVHEFVFAPAGEGIEAAVAEPQEVTFVPGHVHTLAIIGQLEVDSLLLLNVDETVYAADANLSESFFGILVNDLAGSPATVIRSGTGLYPEGEDLPYGQFVARADPASAGGNRMHLEVVDEPPRVIVEAWSAPLPPGLTDLSVISGTYPGLLGSEFAWYWNWGFSGDISTIDSGIIVLGDTVDGELTEITQRARYTLNLDADSTLSIYARTGRAIASRPTLGTDNRFDPTLYVYDAQSRLRYWNDELDMSDASLDAGLEGLHLPAGSYFLEVAAWLDSQAGTYTLELVNAE